MTAETRTFAIFANGSYWGTWDGADAAAAMQAAADDVGTDGSTDGLTAHEVTQAQADAMQEWAEAGCPAAECPIIEER